jgi:hypothetical protein
MSGYPLLDAFWTMLLFFGWLLWLFLVVWVLMDIFRSHDISGWGKAGWTVLVILLPLIGILAYEIVHGDHLFGGRPQYPPEAQGYSDAEYERGKEQAQHVRPVM